MKRVITILLAFLMLLSCVACGENAETPDETVTHASSEAETEFFPDVPRNTYNETFRMIGFNQPGDWYYAEERTNNVLNDAIYEMNVTIEDYLGVDIEYEQITSVSTGGEVFDKVRPHMLAGDDVYQLCILHPYYSYNSFIGGNFAYDFYQFNNNGYTDFEQKYWNKTVIDSLAINDHAFIALGDLCSYTLNVLYANKTLLERVNREMPYDMVKNGGWTMDEFFAMTKDLYIDNDGDGKRNNNDVYGFASMWDANGSAFLQAADIFVVRRNDQDQFELCMNEGDRLTDFYDKLFEWSKDESVYIWSFGNNSNTNVTVPFLNGRSYFTLDSLGTKYLEAEFDVGVLPLPKFDVHQENYQHVNWGNNIVVPGIIKNEAMVGQVIELMAYYTSTIVHEAYYDTVLQYRVSNSPEDREMVQLIYNTVVYDPGIAFCDGNMQLWNLVYTACFGIINQTKNIASYYRGNSRSAQKWLDDLFKDTK